MVQTGDSSNGGMEGRDNMDHQMAGEGEDEQDSGMGFGSIYAWL